MLQSATTQVRRNTKTEVDNLDTILVNHDARVELKQLASDYSVAIIDDFLLAPDAGYLSVYSIRSKPTFFVSPRRRSILVDDVDHNASS